jgi:hypothetical protein
MPLIQPDRSRTGSATCRRSGITSAMALNIRSISSLARFAPTQ